jgi:hypothetical protein
MTGMDSLAFLFRATIAPRQGMHVMDAHTETLRYFACWVPALGRPFDHGDLVLAQKKAAKRRTLAIDSSPRLSIKSCEVNKRKYCEIREKYPDTGRNPRNACEFTHVRSFSEYLAVDGFSTGIVE